MVNRINRTEEFFKRLKEEGKIRTLNSPKDIEAIIGLNKQMEMVHRDFINKSNGR